MAIKIAIIGGSGLDDPELMTDIKELQVETPYGAPSSPLVSGTISGVETVILARHGRDHSIYPTGVNYRANIHALKEMGCTHILATTAVGLAIGGVFVYSGVAIAIRDIDFLGVGIKGHFGGAIKGHAALGRSALAAGANRT